MGPSRLCRQYQSCKLLLQSTPFEPATKLWDSPSRCSDGRATARSRLLTSLHISVRWSRSGDLDALGVSPENSTHIYFRDVILPASDDDEDEELSTDSITGEDISPEQMVERGTIRRQRVDRQKLIIILVGLPGRGKTFLCNKLMCYLNWCACAAANLCAFKEVFAPAVAGVLLVWCWRVAGIVAL